MVRGAVKQAASGWVERGKMLTDSDAWLDPCRYINEKDLAFFQYHAEGSGAMQGAGPWEVRKGRERCASLLSASEASKQADLLTWPHQVMMDKEIPGTLKYTAWRRVLPVRTRFGFAQHCMVTAH